MPEILAYTCLTCGIVTRALRGQDYKVCLCPDGYSVKNEETGETWLWPEPPAEPQQ